MWGWFGVFLRLGGGMGLPFGFSLRAGDAGLVFGGGMLLSGWGLGEFLGL